MSRKLFGVALLAWSFGLVPCLDARAEDTAAAAAPAKKKGAWVASQTAQMDAIPAVIFRFTGDLARWNDWTAWSKERDPSGQWTYEGAAGTVGHAMSWDGPELGQGRLVLTKVEGNTIHYDLFFGKSKTANKGYITVGGEGPASVTWYTEGQLSGFARLFRKKIEEAVNKDFQDGLAKLKPLAEKQSVLERHAARVSDLQARLAQAKAEATAARQRADALLAEARLATMNASDAAKTAKKPAQKQAVADLTAAAEAKKGEASKAEQEAAALEAKAAALAAELQALEAAAPPA